MTGSKNGMFNVPKKISTWELLLVKRKRSSKKAVPAHKSAGILVHFGNASCSYSGSVFCSICSSCLMMLRVALSMALIFSIRFLSCSPFCFALFAFSCKCSSRSCKSWVVCSYCLKAVKISSSLLWMPRTIWASCM